MQDPDRWDLVSANDLAAYHAVRRDLYRTFAELLAAPDAIDFERAHARMTMARSRGSAMPAVRLTLDALGAATAQSLAEEHSRFTDRDVGTCSCVSEVRETALRLAGMAIAPGRVAEMRALATLAGNTALALRSGDVAEASALADAQARFIREHALRCFTEYATALVACGGPVLSAIGIALARQIRDDASMLGGSIPEKGA